MMNRPMTNPLLNNTGWLYDVSNALIAVGAINWGLKGLFRFNLVRALFGWSPFLTRTIYSLVGISGAWLGYRLIDSWSRTSTMAGTGPTIHTTR